MKRIKELRISLLEKEGTKSEEEGKENYIIRSSANLAVEKVLEQHPEFIDRHDELVLETSNAMFGDLIKMKPEEIINSVGIWITFDDNQIIENAIDLETLEKIQEYGAEDVEPFKEFFKMTVEENES